MSVKTIDQNIKDINKQISNRINELTEKLKYYGELEKRQEDAIILFKQATKQRDKDQYNKYYFHTVTKIDKLKTSIFITKTKIKTLESQRTLKLLEI